jgi:hypothetical protein
VLIGSSWELEDYREKARKTHMTMSVIFHAHKPLIHNHLELTVNLVLAAPGTPNSARIVADVYAIVSFFV